jgi:hypothetical protein
MPKMIIWFACAITLLFPYHHAFSEQHNNDSVDSCDIYPKGNIETRNKYEGKVENDDYRFIANIPKGLIGMGNSDSTPFHGFVIYLDDYSCIDFDIGHIVILPEDPPRK